MTTRIHALFSVAASLVVVVAIVLGIVVAGWPWQARIQRFDRQRLNDLQTIFRELQSLCHDPDIKNELKRPLPATLDELAKQPQFEKVNLNDPESGEQYVYTVTGETTYELCANFKTNRDSDLAVFWNHPAGKFCFKLNALDPPKQTIWR